MLKDKKVVIAVAVGAVLVLAGLVYYFFGGNPPEKDQAQKAEQEQIVQTLTTEDLGLKFTSRNDTKAVKFEITNIKDISNVEYTIEYTREETTGEDKGQQVPEALYGNIAVKPGDTKIATDFRDLGTCSSGVCRYHKVVSPLKLVLKITKKDGKVYQAEETLSL
ncbi:MAG: hypothetical protein HYT10_01600 [Candidatus Levybacteria bacterium]|nr:hypothetical protein [Candidatus Levybacteria bacterium]